jgi:hypothetical protein
MATICECVNCGERYGAPAGSDKCAMYCKNCKTADQRKKVNEENNKIREDYAKNNK